MRQRLPQQAVPQKLHSKKVAENLALCHHCTILHKLLIFNMLIINILALSREILGCLRIRRFTLSRNYGKNFSHTELEIGGVRIRTFSKQFVLVP